MFSKFASELKQLGKKAVGYIRGLNGDKAAAFGTSIISTYNPVVGAAAAPFLAKLGELINRRLEEIAKESGVNKPKNREVRKQIKEQQDGVVYEAN